LLKAAMGGVSSLPSFGSAKGRRKFSDALDSYKTGW
jgi:hypothetical protein